jgi:hypothetical protein
MPATAALPDVIYHYTSMDALIKIVKSASIWATAFNYLNDVTEGEHFLRLVHTRSSELRNDEKYARYLPLPDSSSFQGFGHFVASFCGYGDSLNHWRSYCASGNGVAIGFRSRCLEQAMIVGKKDVIPPSMTNATLGAVWYLSTEETEQVDSQIRRAIDTALKMGDSQSSDKHVERTKALTKWFLERQAVFTKNKDFESENEYRLAVSPFFPIESHIQFRITPSTVAPYLELKIPTTLFGVSEIGVYIGPILPGDPPLNQVNFIDRVYVGPSPNQDLSVASVEAFFRTENMEVPVIKSRVPIRNL